MYRDAGGNGEEFSLLHLALDANCRKTGARAV